MGDDFQLRRFSAQNSFPIQLIEHTHWMVGKVKSQTGNQHCVRAPQLGHKMTEEEEKLINLSH